MQLKVYTSQGQVSDTLHAGDIGYVISGNGISTLPSFPRVILFVYDGIGYILLLLSYAIYTGVLIRSKTIQLQLLSFHYNILLSIVLIGVIWIIFEFVATFIYNMRDKSVLTTVWSYGVIMYIFIILSTPVSLCIHCCSKSPITIKFKAACKMMCITLHAATHLFIAYFIYHYALPTFLLLLVHPMKVIATFAYLIAIIFVAIFACSVYMTKLEDFDTFLKFRNVNLHCRLFSLFTYTFMSVVIVNVIIFYLFILYSFTYAMMLNQSLPTVTGPIYTLLSLIPTAIVSFITWILKSKFFDSVSIEELQNAERAEDTTEQTDTNDLNADTEEERLPLLTVEENSNASETAPRSESSPNLHNRHNYGATDAEDRSSETNC